MKTTNRGFDIHEFKDRYGEKCSIQKSSLATEDCIWLGIDEPTVKVMASAYPQIPSDGTGWVVFPIPKDASISSRMHLSQEQVRKLLPMLTKFAETGELR